MTAAPNAPPEERYKVLEEYFTEDEAERVLTTMIDWGRYTELFAYDYDTGLLSLEDGVNLEICDKNYKFQ